MTTRARWIAAAAASILALGVGVVAFRTLDLLDGEGTINHKVDGTVTVNVNVNVGGTIKATFPSDVRIKITLPPVEIRLPSPEGTAQP